MDTLALPQVLGNVARFGSSGKYSDFEILCDPFCFKVHKVIICSASQYFDTLCGGSFMEAVHSSANFDDEDPMTVARMLQACYTGDYGSDEEEARLEDFLAGSSTQNNQDGSSPGGSSDVGTACLVIHAKIYRLADKYDIPNLRRLAIAKFEVCMKSVEVSNEDVLVAAQVIYETIPGNDSQLRKLVVFYTQIHMLELQSLPLFKELMADQDFSWDYGIKYASRAHLWCPECVNWTKISAKCGCGFNGLCEESETCKNQNWNALRCEKCKKQGHLLREEPKDDTELAVSGVMKVGKHRTAPTTPPPTPKKGKF